MLLRTVSVLLLLLTCDAAVLASAAKRAEAFDLRGAVEILRAAGTCEDAGGGVEYLEGLLAMNDAFDGGGTEASLRDVRSAANALSRRAEGGDRRWEAASMAMRAIPAASQQERAEMTIYLAEAMRVEGLLLTAKLPPVPYVTVHELGGDLWMKLHQFADARAAYLRAGSVVGYTPRVRLGLARTAERLGDAAGACGEYRTLLAWWDREPRNMTPPEVADARTQATAVCGKR
jgi:hypothetical protein